MILAVDPGSQRIGWAVMAGARTLVEAGLIESNLKGESLDRVDDIAAKLGDRARTCIEKFGLKEAVMEITSGRIAGRHRGRMVGMQTLGAAVQACRTTLRLSGLEVHCIRENVWTRGVPKLGTSECVVCGEIVNGFGKSCKHRKVPKGPVCGGAMRLRSMGRVDAIADLFKDRDWSFDTGGDVRDAVGIGKYWIEWELPRRESKP